MQRADKEHGTLSWKGHILTRGHTYLVIWKRNYWVIVCQGQKSTYAGLSLCELAMTKNEFVINGYDRIWSIPIKRDQAKKRQD